MEKKRRIVLTTLAALVLGVVAMVLGLIYMKSLNGQNGEFEFAELDNQGVIDFISEKRSGWLYVGRPTCPHCQEFQPILEEVAGEKKITVYYYNTDDANVDKELKGKVLEIIEVSGVPTFMYVDAGVITERLEDPTRGALEEFVGKGVK